MGWDAVPESREYDPITDAAAGRIVSPEYFRTVGIGIVQGRDFDLRDVRSNPLVMAINETFARSIHAEGMDPLSARFIVLGSLRQVVAVVRDVRHRSLDGDPGREVYIPMGQAPSFFQAYDLVVRAANATALCPSMRAAIWQVDRDQAVGNAVGLEEYIGRTLRPRLLLTGVMSLFAVTTLLLAACGSKQPPASEPASTPSPVASAAESPPVVVASNAFVPAPATPGVNVPAIKVDTVGYPAGWRKIAIFNVEPKNAVVKAEDGSVVHTFAKDEIAARGRDAASQDPVWQADFSKLDKNNDNKLTPQEHASAAEHQKDKAASGSTSSGSSGSSSGSAKKY